MSLEAKTIVLTGASSGIGAATAEVLAKQGADIIALDIKPVESAAIQFHSVDLSDPDAIDRFVQELDSPIDGLCNVAGVPGSLPPEVVLRVNYLGLRRLTTKLMPKVRDNGAVVNVASAAGTGWREKKDKIFELLDVEGDEGALAWLAEQQMSGAETYDFSKEAVIVFSMLIASREWHRGVRVNSVSPGAIETPILDDFYQTMDSEALNQFKRQAGGRDGRPEEIAEAIAFMVGPGSRWVNGTDLLVDGGAEVLMNLESRAVAPRAS
ncbi:MAG: coniferyl-alcohol dehydrogenase [Pseudomonadota bacterium]